MKYTYARLLFHNVAYTRSDVPCFGQEMDFTTVLKLLSRVDI
jgi:hypothetical protein